MKLDQAVYIFFQNFMKLNQAQRKVSKNSAKLSKQFRQSLKAFPNVFFVKFSESRKGHSIIPQQDEGGGGQKMAKFCPRSC